MSQKETGIGQNEGKKRKERCSQSRFFFSLSFTCSFSLFFLLNSSLRFSLHGAVSPQVSARAPLSARAQALEDISSLQEDRQEQQEQQEQIKGEEEEDPAAADDDDDKRRRRRREGCPRLLPRDAHEQGFRESPRGYEQGARALKSIDS